MRAAGRGIVMVCLAVAAHCALLAEASAGDLYKPGSWPALASDRAAEKVGDSLTVLIQEASQASDASQNAGQGGVGANGNYSAGAGNHDARLGLSGNYTAGGQNSLSGRMVAQISVVVDDVLPNGDLHVAGDQLININGRKTRIHLTGRVRRADISSANMVLSTSLADATIVYGGPGLDDGGKPGLLGRMFSWMKP